MVGLPFRSVSGRLRVLGGEKGTAERERADLARIAEQIDVLASRVEKLGLSSDPRGDTSL